MTLPKLDSTLDWKDSSSYLAVPSRKHNALIRSHGNRRNRKTGRWGGVEAKPFFKNGLVETPGLGDPVEGHYLGKPFWFRPTLSRAVRGTMPFLPSTDIKLPDVTDPDPVTYEPSLISDGTQSIRICRPGNPLASLSVFIAELRDLPKLPQIYFRRGKDFLALGDQYLNADFGWASFISDLRNLYAAQRRLANVLDSLVANNGLSIRRRRRIKHDTTTSTLASGLIADRPWCNLGNVPIGGNVLLDPLYCFGPYDPVNFLGADDGSLSYISTKVTHLDEWFVGTFRYYVPDIGSSQWTRNAISALYGGGVTPNILWQVMPWSWLIDWFSSVGDIMSNLSDNAVDNEVYENCSVQLREVVEIETVVGVSWGAVRTDSGIDFPEGSSQLTHRITRDTKMRYPSSPFGFGIDWPDFSLRQIAIAAALAFPRTH